MVSRYSIIQYIPDPIADERINIGVLAFDDNSVQVKFLSRWDRVSSFAPVADVSFLRKSAQQMQTVSEDGLLFPGDRPNGQLTLTLVTLVPSLRLGTKLGDSGSRCI